MRQQRRFPLWVIVATLGLGIMIGALPAFSAFVCPACGGMAGVNGCFNDCGWQMEKPGGGNEDSVEDLPNTDNEMPWWKAAFTAFEWGVNAVWRR